MPKPHEENRMRKRTGEMLEMVAVAALLGAAARPCLGQSIEALAAQGTSALLSAQAQSSAIAAKRQNQAHLNAELYEAAIRGDERAVISDITQGADVNAIYAPSVGNRPLDGAAIFGFNAVAVSRTLLEAGADINARDLDGMTALAYDAQYGRANVIRMILARFSHRLRASTVGDALASAAEFEQGAVVRELLDAGADPNSRARGGKSERRATALMLAIENAGTHLGVVRLLLSRHADVNARDSQGATALMYAARFSNAAAGRLLLAAGADSGARDRSGRTAHDIAAEVAREQAARDAWCKANPGFCED